MIDSDINGRSHLDIREVGPDNAVHDTPDVRDGVLVANLNTKLFANEAASTLTTEQVLGANGLDNVGVQALQVNLHRVRLVEAIVLESSDRPRPLDGGAGLLDLVEEHGLDLALVDKGGKRVSRVDEARAAGPVASPLNTLSIGARVPERDIVHLGGVVGHDVALQPQVAQDFGGSWLNAIGATSGGRHGTVVDVLHLVAPAGHAKREENANGACAHDDNVIFLGVAVVRHYGTDSYELAESRTDGTITKTGIWECLVWKQRADYLLTPPTLGGGSGWEDKEEIVIIFGKGRRAHI